jgi:hypothetical protein
LDLSLELASNALFVSGESNSDERHHRGHGRLAQDRAVATDHAVTFEAPDPAETWCGTQAHRVRKRAVGHPGIGAETIEDRPIDLV